MGLNPIQRIIVRLLPFRLNLYLQLHVWKKGIYFVGMNETQRKIANKKYGPSFEPPWLAFPDYEMHSMGFRMGSGEDYNIQFSNWYNSASLEEIESFKQQFPEIEKYSGYYSSKDKWRKEYREKNDLRN